ncbi:transcriptional regulator [Longimycelium tulufanense]|uniref:Transcriptional regulator n=1 Tax=Longimycelium tulufanense TaxID=907463 RepID=A0A8J3C700_9PSEU|nr:helix-turn-helix transcriptional regulator [Longimycelium tulufanense]GGM45351.1 transcriptional regulator [Longimycelium tulufanense]
MLLVEEIPSLETTEDARRRELNALLRACRARLRRDQVGLPLSLSRRDTGLRQEDVAIMAGLSTRWYAAFERGELTTPNSQILESISRVLRMDEAERTCLYLLASGHEPTRHEAPRATVDAGLREFVRSQVPKPTMVTDLSWQLLCWNSAVTEWFANFSDHNEEDRNFALWLFSEDAAQRFVEINSERCALIGQLHTDYARHPGHPDLERVISRLLAISHQARVLWDQFHLAPSNRYFTTCLSHPRYGQRGMFGVTVKLRSGLRLLTFTPARRPARRQSA